MAQTLQLTLPEDLRRRLEVCAEVEATRPDEMALRLLDRGLPDESERAGRRRALVGEVVNAIKVAQVGEDMQRRAGYLCAAQDRLWQLWQIRPQGEALYGPIVALLRDVLRLNPPERWTKEAFTSFHGALHALIGDLTDARLAEVVSTLQAAGLQTLPYPSDADWEENQAEVDV